MQKFSASTKQIYYCSLRTEIYWSSLKNTLGSNKYQGINRKNKKIHHYLSKWGRNRQLRNRAYYGPKFTYTDGFTRLIMFLS